jgi:hypothetical protein
LFGNGHREGLFFDQFVVVVILFVAFEGRPRRHRCQFGWHDVLFLFLVKIVAKKFSTKTIRRGFPLGGRGGAGSRLGCDRGGYHGSDNRRFFNLCSDRSGFVQFIRVGQIQFIVDTKLDTEQIRSQFTPGIVIARQRTLWLIRHIFSQSIESPEDITGTQDAALEPVVLPRLPLIIP